MLARMSNARLVRIEVHGPTNTEPTYKAIIEVPLGTELCDPLDEVRGAIASHERRVRAAMQEVPCHHCGNRCGFTENKAKWGYLCLSCKHDVSPQTILAAALEIVRRQEGEE